MKIKELSIVVRPSSYLKDHYTVDIKVIANGREKTVNEYVPTNDFKSRFIAVIELAKDEVIKEFERFEDEN